VSDIDFTFRPAVKTGLFARLALIGIAGSGKTLTALKVGAALGDNIGVLDTEHGRAAWYKHEVPFRHLIMSRFDPADLTAAVAAAGEQGIDPLIVDSWSHFWFGAAGMLDQVDAAAARMGSRFSADGWKAMRPVERAMVDALIGYPGHVIVTLRQKTEYVIDKDPGTGRIEMRRVGLKPEQRDGLEFEFDVVAELADATMTVVKTRVPALRRYSAAEPGADVGEAIAAWIAEGDEEPPFNVLDVRDWAQLPGRTAADVDAKAAELERLGRMGSVLLGDDGQPVTLRAYLREAWRRLRAAEKAAAPPAA
jgi:AAA domain